MKLAIVGYGNLGKSLEKEIETQNGLELVGIYSRRNLDNAKYRPLNDIARDNDFDAVLVALGSYNDIALHAWQLAKFDTVDSFDTHAVMEKYKRELTLLNPERIAVVGAGWDPGLLSLIRGVFAVDAEPTTVWGKGISQGHSNAVRSIAGVIDAVQFTVPKPNCKDLLQSGVTDGTKLHDRICYVAAVESDKKDIERQIKNMPNYFEEYETLVKFVTPAEVKALKKDTSHCGQVYAGGNGYTASARIELNCNTELTAKVMLKYATALPKLKADGYRGALDPFDIPLRYVADKGLI